MITLDFKPSRSSDAYRFTTTCLACVELENLKTMVKAHNKEVRAFSRKHGRSIGKLKRISIMPRGPRAAAAKADGFKFKRAYDSYLPQIHGEHFDIYVNEDGSNQYELKRELDTGMSPGELKKYDALKRQVWHMEITARGKKNKWSA